MTSIPSDLIPNSSMSIPTESFSVPIDSIKDAVIKDSKISGFVSKATDIVLTKLKDAGIDFLNFTVNFSANICFIVGAVGLFGMVLDFKDDLKCSRFVIGSTLVYIGLKCVQMLLV